MPKTNVERHSIRNGIIVTVVGGLILAAIVSPTLRQWVSESIATTWKLIMGTWHYLLSSVAIPHWLFGLLLLLSLITLFRAIRPLFKSQGIVEPTWESYTQDQFLGMVWRWDYLSNDPLHSLRPFCPRCDTILVYSMDIRSPDLMTMTSFTCETCGREIATLEGDRSYVLAKVGRQIDRKIRTGEWKQAISKS